MSDEPGGATMLSSEDLAEYQSKVGRLRGLMAEAGLDGFILADPNHFDTRWLTGYRFELPGDVDNPELKDWMGDLSGAERTAADPPWKIFVVVPLTGEPIMVMSPGFMRSWHAVVRQASWIQQVVGTYSEDPEWERKHYWGLVPTDTEEDLARAIRDAGLERARIGVLGTWAAFERTKARFPEAQFVPAVAPDPLDGVERDFITILTTTPTPYELERMGRAQTAWEAGVAALREAATPGTLYLDAMNEAKYATGKGGSRDPAFGIGVGSAETVWTFIAPYHPASRFKKGDMINAEMINEVDGCYVQNCRSWVIGGPNKTQTHVLETSKRALDEAINFIKPGTTGEEVYNLHMEIFKQANLHPWARTGHYEGPRIDWVDHRWNFMPGVQTPIPEGRTLVIHPPCYDKATMAVGLMGEMVVVEDKGCRMLSPKPATFDFASHV